MGLVPKLPRRAWVVLGGDLLCALGSGLTMPFFIVYLHRVRGIDLTVAGFTLATIALASFAGNLIGGSFADRIGPRRTLMAGLCTSAAGCVWLAFVTSPAAGFGAAACVGLGNSVSWPALDSLLATVVEESQRSTVFALRHATLNLGLGLGSVLAATVVVVSSTRSFQTLYLLDAATFVAFVPVLALLRGVGERVESEEVVTGGYREVLRDRTFLAVWGLGALFVAFGFSQYEAALPPYATSTGGISAHALGFVFAANTLGVAVLQLIVLRAVEGRRRTSALAGAAAAFALAWCIAIVAAHAGGGKSAVVIFAAGMFVLALGETLVSPSLAPIVNDIAPDRLRGRYNGTFVLAYTTGFMVGPSLAGGGLRVGDGTAYFVLLVAGCSAAFVWSLSLRRRLPPAIDRIGEGKNEQPLPVQIEIVEGGLT
jgi:MFS family permease